MWTEPRLVIPSKFQEVRRYLEFSFNDIKYNKYVLIFLKPENILKEFEEEGDMVPVNVELVNHLWLPNIFIYNLKTFKVTNLFKYFQIFFVHNLKTFKVK